MKKVLISIISCLFLFTAHARNAQEAFLSMPAAMMKDVSVENRMDLIESYEANSKNTTTVQNKLGGDMFIEILTEDYMRLNMGNTSIQIVVLPMKDYAQAYCFIRTTCAPECDSRIEFYSTEWKLLDVTDFIQIAPMSDFISEPENFPLLNTLSLMQFKYDHEKKVLEQVNNSIQILSLEDQKKVKPNIKKEQIKYGWSNLRFVQKPD